MKTTLVTHTSPISTLKSTWCGDQQEKIIYKGVLFTAGQMLQVCFIWTKIANYLDKSYLDIEDWRSSFLSHDDDDDDGDDTEHWSSKCGSCCIQLILPRDCTACLHTSGFLQPWWGKLCSSVVSSECFNIVSHSSNPCSQSPRITRGARTKLRHVRSEFMEIICIRKD